ncbi:MAG: galactokinase [Clostridia bacterium]|nr:galactokinase [Clostridia bacterium]
MEIREMKQMFFEYFGGEDKNIRFFASPGRVNLIGEHTDYNGGFVFPGALKMKTTIMCRVRDDKKIRLMATDLKIMVEADIDNLANYKDLKWGDYQLGTIYEMMCNGYEVMGMDMLYDDTVPHGSGLSSSAAIEVSTALCVATLSNEKKGITTPVDMIEMAKLSQMAEHNYIGVKCGIMDQFSSAMGKEGHAIFLDCKDLSYKYVKLNLDGKKIVIANTNKKHSLGNSAYNQRRMECEKGLEILKTAMPEKTCLGEISLAEFDMHKHLIDDEIVLKRVEHVISEDDRVLKSVEALGIGDVKEFGRLMNASHDSLRDLYEVTCLELDTIVDEARKIKGTLGARMTGAGFGGSTVSIVEADYVDEFIEKVGKAYTEITGLTADFYVTELGDGGREILA